MMGICALSVCSLAVGVAIIPTSASEERIIKVEIGSKIIIIGGYCCGFGGILTALGFMH
jgi:hypothetical protein